MVEGWEKLKDQNPDKTIDVRFITTQAASKNDKIEAYSGAIKPSFYDFINNLWEPIKSGKYTNGNQFIGKPIQLTIKINIMILKQAAVGMSFYTKGGMRDLRKLLKITN
ncbi:Uncharacterised protein [Sphingobacterium multivorum]|uniref:Uncharacterized protein n=2 Tax=Sphingobacterium multivorum TaxID=28454 RepID=A0A2X2ISY7_SPHMU|nr:Uncharacterised protein [Sphingobacterium multivorum]